jgi:hypothetical protein
MKPLSHRFVGPIRLAFPSRALASPGPRSAGLTLGLALVGLLLLAVDSSAQSTAFVYQGRLEDSTLSPATGEYDMTFTLWDAEAGGSQIGVVAHEGVELRQGLFSVTLDFGVSAFAGADRFLEIAVQGPADPEYTTLEPRQQLHSSPYAIRTLYAGTADSALFAEDAGNLGGIGASGYLLVDGSGAGLTGLNASNLASGTVPDARLSSNVARTNTSQTFTGNQTVAGNLTVVGTLSASSVVARVFQVSELASVAWTIDAPSDYQSNNNQNPTLVLQRGLTYQFNLATPGHPFRIASSNGGPAYNVGITNNDLQVGVLTFKVPMDAQSTLFYYCLVHPGMSGTIVIP